MVKVDRAAFLHLASQDLDVLTQCGMAHHPFPGPHPSPSSQESELADNSQWLYVPGLLKAVPLSGAGPGQWAVNVEI